MLFALKEPQTATHRMRLKHAPKKASNASASETAIRQCDDSHKALHVRLLFFFLEHIIYTLEIINDKPQGCQHKCNVILTCIAATPADGNRVRISVAAKLYRMLPNKKI